MRTSILAALALLLPACTPLSDNTASEDVSGNDPLGTTIILEGDFGRADVLIYDNSALRMLVAHLRSTVPRMELRLHAGDYTAVALAGIDGELVDAAVQRYESIEALRYRYCDEDPEEKFQSAVTSLVAGSECTLRLEPLLCEIEVLSIEQPGEGPRARDLKLWLMNVNAEAEALRRAGFRPEKMLDCWELSQKDLDSMRRPQMMYLDLCCDMGRFTLYPHCSLYCYPNDDPGAGIGTPRTVLVLEATLGGQSRRWEYELGPLERGQKTSLCLQILDI